MPSPSNLATGAAVFGRGIVLRTGSTTPQPWANADRIPIDSDALAEPADLIRTLHLAWVQRQPSVIEWAIADDALSAAEKDLRPPYELDDSHLFPHERIRFLAFANNYDARSDDIVWWWTTKAARLGVTPSSGDADATGPDGAKLWIDGGPREPLDLPADMVCVSGEDIDAGRLEAMSAVPPIESSNLASDQLAAVDHGAGAARIIAPAGSGKTRTLTARARRLVEDWKVHPSQVLAVAYNRRAADELRTRLGSRTADVRTVHSLGWAILSEARPGLELINEPAVRSHLNRVFSIPKRANADPTGPYLEALDDVRIGLEQPIDVETARDDVPGFADGFDAYRDRLARRGEIDYGEQVYSAIEALLRDPVLRARWQRRCRHVLVDEFQDMTPAYLLLIRLVASPQLQVFGVGDDDQVIYGYAGADPDYLIEFDNLFPGSSEQALDTNYRCAPSIVEAATNLLGYNRRRIEKTIRAARSKGHGLEVVRAPGDNLAATAAETVRAWIESGAAPSDIAILSRVNSSLIPAKAALRAAEVPTNDLLGPDSLQRTAVRALFAWIRLALAPEEMTSADAIEAIRRPSRGLTTIAREVLTRRRTSLGDLAGIAAQLDSKQADRWYDFIEQLEGAIDLADQGSAPALVRHLTDDVGLTSTARTLDSARTSAARSSHSDDLVAIRRAAALHDDVTTLIPWLTDIVSTRSDPAGVTLSSIHRVKGMEWPHVIVFGVDRGSMPHELSTDREEERRVCHVAITRAQDRCVVLADKQRPSRFLDELDGTATVEPQRPTRTERASSVISSGPQLDDRVTLRGGLKGVVTARSSNSIEIRLDTGAEIVASIADVVAVDRSQGAADPELAQRLRDWRRAKASELGVPAYIVLHDATIDDLAARRPTTERELAAVSGIGPSKIEHYGDEILSLTNS